MTDLRPSAHVVEVLRGLVSRTPDSDAVLFVGDPGAEDSVRTWSYAELDTHARRIGAWLGDRFLPGERVLLPFEQGLDFAAAFFGCLYAGMIAVPVPVPGQYRHQRERLTSIAKNAGVRAVLTDAVSLPAVREWSDEQLGDAALIAASDDEDFGDAGAWKLPDMDHDTLALLQYTSGSTSEPKGVMISHGNLLHNISALHQAFPIGPKGRHGGWIPTYHDMGLMGILLPGVLLGHSAVLMSPTTFIRRPHLWLQLVDTFDVTFSAAPNFAYDLCVSRITDAQCQGIDLSRWQYACSGSEPVRAATLRSFAERFAPAGLREDAVVACYGLAEATVFVSGTGRRAAPVQRVDTELLERHEFRPLPSGEAGRDLVGCGAVRELEARIVDPETRRALPAGQVGEIWLRGPSVSSGYWQHEVATEAAFAGATTDGDTGYLRTGDLGTLHEGELYITGRIKETLIMRGRNLYPQDIEHELRDQHPALGAAGAAFTVPLDDGEEALVVTHEVRAGKAGDLAELTTAMRRTVAHEFGVHAAGIILLRPGAVRRTTSGKIQRTAMRQLFRTGGLTPQHADCDPRLAVPTPTGDNG